QAYRNAQRRGQGEKDQSGGIQQYATHRIVPCGGGGYTSLGDRASGNRSFRIVLGLPVLPRYLAIQSSNAYVP
ncbi:hypothetical protein, partial [Lactobacillus crispatus]|uniref:hypothetical protein n=1 Tax=Lactobacillus crispatus TaxID=47770 RepID=UPI00197C509D